MNLSFRGSMTTRAGERLTLYNLVEPVAVNLTPASSLEAASELFSRPTADGIKFNDSATLAAFHERVHE